MDPYEPPKAPALHPEQKEGKPPGALPLNIASTLLVLNVFVSNHWMDSLTLPIYLLAFLFSLTGLLLARHKRQRVSGVIISCVSAGGFLFLLWLRNSY